MSYIPATSPVPLPLGGAYAPAQSPVPLPLSGAAGGIEPVQRGYAVPVLSFTATGPAQAEFTLPGPVEVTGEAITQQNMFDLPQLSIAAEMTHTPYYYWFGDTSEITSGQPWRHQHWNLIHDYIFDKTLEAYGTADTGEHSGFVNADRQGDWIFRAGQGGAVSGVVFVTNRRVYVSNRIGTLYYADLEDGVAPESFILYGRTLPFVNAIPIYVHSSAGYGTDRLYFWGNKEGVYVADVLPDGGISDVELSNLPLPWADDVEYWENNHFVTPVVCSDILYIFRDDLENGSVAWTKINSDGTLRGDWQTRPLTDSRSSSAEYIYVRAPSRNRHDRLYRLCGYIYDSPANALGELTRTVDYIEINKATGEILTDYGQEELSFIQGRDLFEAYSSSDIPDTRYYYLDVIYTCSTGRYLLCDAKWVDKRGSDVKIGKRLLAEIYDDASLSVFIPCSARNAGEQYFITSSRIYSFCEDSFRVDDMTYYGLNLTERSSDKFLSGDTVSGEFLGGSDNLVTFDPASLKYLLKRPVTSSQLSSIIVRASYRQKVSVVSAKSAQYEVKYILPHYQAILVMDNGVVSEYPIGTTLSTGAKYDFPRTTINAYHRLPGWNEGHYYIPKEKVFAYGIRSGIGLFDAFAGYLLPVPLAVYANCVFTPPIVIDYVLPIPEIQGTASASEPATAQYILPFPVQVQGWGEATPPVTARYILPLSVRISGKGQGTAPVTVQYDLPSTLRIRARINNVVATARYDLPLPVRMSGQVFGFQYELPGVRIQGFACGSVQRGNPVALYRPRLLRVQGQAVYSALQTARCRIKMPALDVLRGRLVPGAVLSGLDIKLHNLRVRADGAVNSVAVTIVLPQAKVSAQMILRTGAEFDAEHSGTVQFILPLLDIDVDSESAQVQELRSTVYKDGMGYVFRPPLFDGYGIVSPAVLAGVYDLSGVMVVEARVDVGKGTPVFQYNREMEV